MVFFGHFNVQNFIMNIIQISNGIEILWKIFDMPFFFINKCNAGNSLDRLVRLVERRVERQMYH